MPCSVHRMLGSRSFVVVMDKTVLVFWLYRRKSFWSPTTFFATLSSSFLDVLLRSTTLKLTPTNTAAIVGSTLLLTRVTRDFGKFRLRLGRVAGSVPVHVSICTAEKACDLSTCIVTSHLIHIPWNASSFNLDEEHCHNVTSVNLVEG